MGAPLFQVQVIGPGLAGWDGPLQGTLDMINTWLEGQPHQHKRLARVSSSNANYPGVRNLKDFPATLYQGHYAYLVDPEAGEKAHVYSDGTDWRYVLTDNALTGIT